MKKQKIFLNHKFEIRLDLLLHFIKHFLDCGESHPSVLVTGFGLFTIIGIYMGDIINYLKDKINVYERMVRTKDNVY